MSSPPILQQLRLLNRSSPDFHEQLGSVLYGQEHQQCVPNLQGDDLMWLVDYLDKVRRRIALLTLRSGQRRLSMISIPPVQSPESVYAN